MAGSSAKIKIKGITGNCMDNLRNRFEKLMFKCGQNYKFIPFENKNTYKYPLTNLYTIQIFNG
jgi:hypothetical protein